MPIDEKNRDSVAKLTDGLVDGHLYTDQRSRVLSAPHGEYLQLMEFLGSESGLGESVYTEQANINMRLMISKDGLSRGEFVAGLGRIFDREKGQYLGPDYQIIGEAIDQAQKGGKYANTR